MASDLSVLTTQHSFVRNAAGDRRPSRIADERERLAKAYLRASAFAMMDISSRCRAEIGELAEALDGQHVARSRDRIAA